MGTFLPKHRKRELQTGAFKEKSGGGSRRKSNNNLNEAGDNSNYIKLKKKVFIIISI
jgi:hypothetical protein